VTKTTKLTLYKIAWCGKVKGLKAKRIIVMIRLFKEYKKKAEARRLLSDLQKRGNNWDKIRYSKAIMVDGLSVILPGGAGGANSSADRARKTNHGRVLHYLIRNGAPGSWIDNLMHDCPQDRVYIDPEHGGIVHATAARIITGGDNIINLIKRYPELKAQAILPKSRQENKTPLEILRAAPESIAKKHFQAWIIQQMGALGGGDQQEYEGPHLRQSGGRGG
jgi:hypothetical protein